MSKRFPLGFIALLGFIAAASLPALAEDTPCQIGPEAKSGCLLIAAHPAAQSDDRAALDLYRRGLARAQKGQSPEAFGDFNRALELDPNLAVAY